MGLERHNLQCILATDPDDKHVIVTDRIPSPLAHAWLIEYLFQRMEAFVEADENLSLERNASAWFFECWSQGVEDGDPAYTDFPRRIREQEWSLVSRDTLSLEEPVISSFTIDQEPDDVPPREQRLATAYSQSTVGIFEIVAVDGPTVTVRDADSGRTHRYYEHSEEADPYPGLLIVGRMIPVEDDLWLRSPGAMILRSRSDDFRNTLSASLTALCETLPTPIALEGLISTTVYSAKVPVPLLPAPTVTDARGALLEARETLENLGFFDEIGLPQTPQAMLDQLESPLQEVGLGVDQPVAEWILALFDQAALDAERPANHPRKRKRQKQSKQQPKRRRK
jgi:hypothetical protein